MDQPLGLSPGSPHFGLPLVPEMGQVPPSSHGPVAMSHLSGSVPSDTTFQLNSQEPLRASAHQAASGTPLTHSHCPLYL